MALTGLDKSVMRTILTEVWRQELGTRMDPANGKWFEDGADHGGRGLYGDLTDTASTEVIFDESRKIFTPDTIICETAIVDNSEGYTPHATVELSYTVTDSTTTTHSTTDSIRVGWGVDINARASIEVISAGVTQKFSFDYTHSWTNSRSENETKSYTFKESVSVDPPKGRVYQVVLTAVSQKLTVPYRAIIYVDGCTETWFERPVRGHYNWIIGAGDAFRDIAQWGKAGAESHSYGQNHKNYHQGIITQEGIVGVQETADFKARTYDITDSLIDGRVSGLPRTSAIESEPISGNLVQEISF